MGRSHRLPILPDLVGVLEEVCKGKERTAKLFPSDVDMRTFDRDLARAGVRKVNTEGKRLVLHSLRYTFCTLLAGTLPLKVVQRLMRHNSLKQTADLYLQLDLDSMLDEVVAMPRLLTMPASEGSGASNPSDPTASPTFGG